MRLSDIDKAWIRLPETSKAVNLVSVRLSASNAVVLNVTWQMEHYRYIAIAIHWTFGLISWERQSHYDTYGYWSKMLDADSGSG